MHPTDAAARNIVPGQRVRVFNDRGSYQAVAIVGEVVKQGVVATLGLYWRRWTNEGYNCNVLTSTALTDLGGGGTFFDALVDVEAVV
jgi:anaerobic selenocysteine-containing dehydrogenase